MTGPSGAGKGTLEKALLDRRPDLELAVSATTRERRPNEQDGREYWFLTREEFQRRVDDGEFLEWVPYVGHRYGTLRSEIDRIGAAGRVPLLDLEIEGALNVGDTVPGAVTVFVDAPLPELERRLRERATESTGEIGERLELAREQKTRAGEFDHVVVNEDLERAVGELLAIVDGELAAAGSMRT
ncbi:MAG: guanylate kinase [Actinomycetota bacterium]|nr:guanylate kinase [Actinomycetota bacterium]